MMKKMKDSGIDWIGQIPEEWKKIKLKHLAEIINGYTFKSDSYTDSGISVIRITNVDDGKLNNNNPRYYSESYEEEIGNAMLKENDILMTLTGNVGFVGIVDKSILPAGLNQRVGCIRLKNDNVENKFLFYYFSNKKFQEIAMLNANGTAQLNMSTDWLQNQRIVIPSIIQQQKIAGFLDDKVGEIDAIISKTKQSIDDYKKYKQAVITESITQGLDKSVEMIDTGNVHIPSMPVHWQMKKMKYIFEIKKDIAGKEGYDILSITQKGIKVKDISRNEGQLAQDYSNYQLVDIGDFAMNHMDLLTGWVDISKYVGVTSPDYRVFRFIDATGYDADYYLYLMQMCYMNRIFYGLGQGVSNLGRWRLQADKFLNFTIPEPPLEEQQEIAKYLSARCTEIDALIAKKESFVDEMETYKKSLIYEYVTGKKEVK